MKMRKIYYIAAALFLSLPLASCSDDDDYTPGPEPAAGCPSVYFPLQDEYSYTFSSDSPDKTMNIVVKRLDTTSALSVPVTLTSDVEGFSAPAEIKFAAGENETVLAIDCSSIPTKQEHSVSVSFDESYSNPYTEGTRTITLKALVSDWTLWAENARFKYDSYYNDTYSDIYAMPGTKKFKIENFLGSGIDLPFEVDDPSASYSMIIPTHNADWYVNYYPEDAFQCWYLYDQDNDGWPAWSPDGVSEPKMTYALIYSYGDGYYYTYIRFGKRTGGVTIDASYDDGSYNWQYVTFSYSEPLFEMF